MAVRKEAIPALAEQVGQLLVAAQIQLALLATAAQLEPALQR
jgi:hypothetical protein